MGGKGIMVRPQRVIEDLGVDDGEGLSKKMRKGSKQIRALLEDIAYEKEEEYEAKMANKKKKRKREKERDNANYRDDYEEWRPPRFDDFEDDHGDAFVPRNNAQRAYNYDNYAHEARSPRESKSKPKHKKAPLSMYE